MPLNSQADNSIEEGLKNLQQSFMSMAELNQKRNEQAIMLMREKTQQMGASANLLQAIAMNYGHAQLNNEALNQLTNGLISVNSEEGEGGYREQALKSKENIASEKMSSSERQTSQRIQASQQENVAKRAWAQTALDQRASARSAVQQREFDNSVAKMKMAFAHGDDQTALKLVSDHMNRFGMAGDSLDVANSTAAVNAEREAVGKPDVNSAYGTGKVAPAIGKAGISVPILGNLGAQQITYQDANKLLGNKTPAAFHDYQDAAMMAHDNPKQADKIKAFYFKQYPELKGKVDF